MTEGSAIVRDEKQMMKGRERATAGKPSGPKVARDVKRGSDEKMTTQKKKVIKRDRKEGEWMTAQKRGGRSEWRGRE